MSVRLGCLLVLLVATSGCPATRTRLACAHCACAGTPRSISRPIACTTIDYESSCCFSIGIGNFF